MNHGHHMIVLGFLSENHSEKFHFKRFVEKVCIKAVNGIFFKSSVFMAFHGGQKYQTISFFAQMSFALE